MRKSLTKKEFISRSSKIHNNFYNYSPTIYKNQNTKVKIICPLHGIFEQRPDHHLAGRKCKLCSCKSKKNLDNKQLAFKNFILRAKNKWNNKYDYSQVIYETARKKVEIICPKHGVFEQSPDSHLKHDCLKCSIENNIMHQQHTTEDFIKKARGIHGDKFDYSKTYYKGNRSKVEIICKIHGPFWQAPYNHLQNKGCLACKNKSKGEEKIKKLLESKNINFKQQKTFKGCKYKKTLRFDFYISEKNICIEYNGKQHYKSIDYFGGKSALIKQQKRDKIKAEYCRENNIQLLIIKYNENIERVLNKVLFKFF